MTTMTTANATANAIVMPYTVLQSAIIDNRGFAHAQLSASDFTSDTAWGAYKSACDTVAITAYDRISGHDMDGKAFEDVCYKLARAFGLPASSVMGSAIKPRLLAACTRNRIRRSIKMSDLRTERRDLEKRLQELIKADMLTASIEVEIRCKEAEIEEERKNAFAEWRDIDALVTSNHQHATSACRKAIEDLMADILLEREFMTQADMEREAAELREHNRQIREAKKAARK